MESAKSSKYLFEPEIRSTRLKLHLCRVKAPWVSHITATADYSSKISKAKDQYRRKVYIHIHIFIDMHNTYIHNRRTISLRTPHSTAKGKLGFPNMHGKI